jgi:hypothetical protein
MNSNKDPLTLILENQQIIHQMQIKTAAIVVFLGLVNLVALTVFFITGNFHGKTQPAQESCTITVPPVGENPGKGGTNPE